MLFNSQTDKRWAKESMGIPEDKLDRWGCLVTVLANIKQLRFNSVYTPKDLNDFIKQNSLYFGDTYKGKESFIKTDELLKLWNCKRTEFSVSGELKVNLGYYYASVILFGGTHFINIICKVNDLFIGFDVNDGRLKTYEPSMLLTLNRIDWL